MGYSVYLNDKDRWAGYGVPATCDHPGCEAEIDRGLAYLCGEMTDKGCGLFFCAEHLWWGVGGEDPQLCQRCIAGEPPFDATPDTPEWVEHMLNDESWAQWRKENPAGP